MGITDSIIHYRRFLKRKNYSKYTVRNYMSTLRQFILWLPVPVEQATSGTILIFIDHLLDKRLNPKTINCYLKRGTLVQKVPWRVSLASQNFIIRTWESYQDSQPPPDL